MKCCGLCGAVRCSRATVIPTIRHNAYMLLIARLHSGMHVGLGRRHIQFARIMRDHGNMCIKSVVRASSFALLSAPVAPVRNMDMQYLISHVCADKCVAHRFLADVF